MNEIVKLAIDCFRGQTGNYSQVEANEVLRKALAEVAGADEQGKIDYKTFRKNKVAIFEILEEVMEETVNEGLEGQFDNFAEYRNLAWGDKNLFIKPDNSIFKTALISDGNGNLRRQKLRDGEEFSIDLHTKGIKLYEEFHRFLSGRISWTNMIQKVARSFQIELANDIYDAVYNSFGAYGAPYHITGTYSEDKLVDIASHVEAGTGESVSIYGTKKALSKVAPSVVSDNMRDARNRDGYYGIVAGYNLHSIKQSHKIGTDEFAIDDDFLLILPEAHDKMVKIVNEGQAIIQENPGGQSADMSMEYMFSMKFGVSLIPSKVYGIFRLS